jgi:signal transduction histidine kinase/streptogramin lyase
MAVACTSSIAIAQVPALKSFDHQSWNSSAGAPRRILAITQTSDGYLWLGSPDGLFRFDGQSFLRYQAQPEPALPPDSALSLLSLPNGDLWIGYNSGRISLLQHGHAVNYGVNEGVSLEAITSLAQRRDGTVWAGGLSGLKVLKSNRWSWISGEWNFPGPAARALYVDRAGTLWVATDKTILYLAAGSRKFRSTHIDAGLVGQIVAAPNGRLWMAETTRAVRPLPLKSRLPPTGEPSIRVGSQGIQFAADGSLWLTTVGDGLRRVIRPYELKGHPDRFSHAIERFTAEDGLSSDIAFSIFEDRDGNIWVGTEAGLDRFRNPVKTILSQKAEGMQPSPASILSIFADGHSWERWTDVKLEAGTKKVQISYTAPELTHPNNIRFRYKLQGFDSEWQDAGTRRIADYMNLRPGTYHFYVESGDGTGAWSSAAAVVGFTIPALWFQLRWLQVSGVALIVLVLWSLHRLRMRQLERQFSLALGTRVDERTRIARELHDTLLQSFHGLMFQFQGARNLLPHKVGAAIQAMDRAILATEEAIAEGRDAIRDLRPETATQHDLAELLSATGEEMAEMYALNGSSPAFRVLVEGTPRRLLPALQSEIYRIGREIIRNAFHHAGAGHIEVEIHYDDHQLRLRIRDDGKGIDSRALLASGRAGHWGIPGIRERAQQVGSQLEFWSQPGAGTEAELRFPAAVIYEKQRHRFRLFHWRKGDANDV